MTLSEFSTRYHLTTKAVESLFERINLPPNTPIDEELEGILLNLSDTRVPVYPPTRRSAVSPSEIEVLLKHYELYVEADVFFSEGFYAFGSMLLGLLQKTGKTLPIPADMVVALQKKIAADPNNQSLGALKSLLVQLARSGCGVASPIQTTPGLSFAETVFRSCPGRNLAILAQGAAIPQALLQEAERGRQYLAFFTLDDRGYMRVNREITLLPNTAPSENPPILHVQAPATAPTNAPSVPASPIMTRAGTLEQESVPAPPRGISSDPTPQAALLNKAPQPLQPAAPAADSWEQYPAPKTAPIGETEPLSSQHHRSEQLQTGVYPAYPVQDVTQLTPGAVPHPFPGPEAQPSKPPMHMEPLSSPVPVHPAPSFPASEVQYTGPSLAPLPKQETQTTAPVPPAYTAAPSPSAPPATVSGSAVQSEPAGQPPLPPGVTRNAQGRLVKHCRLRKSTDDTAYNRSPAPQSAVPSAPPAEGQKDLRQPILIDMDEQMPAPVSAGRQPTMKERFVQGLENMPEEERDSGAQTQKLSITLKALYAALAVLGLGIAGIIVYQFLFS